MPEDDTTSDAEKATDDVEVSEEKTVLTGNWLSGAVGAGLALVVMPCVLLYLGIAQGSPIVGLPILAIFGIMILFGSLALIAALFAGLELSDRKQALGLPDGSMRAAIALSLIVLFAIISIMLYQSISKTVVFRDLDGEQKEKMLKDVGERMIAVESVCVAATPIAKPDPAVTPPPCAEKDWRYSVHVIQPAARESTDLAKQLLILIGTLMTSVTSFYFASRANEPDWLGAITGVGNANADANKPGGGGNQLRGSEGGQFDTTDEADVDGCDVPIVAVTSDEELPGSTGGVA